VRDGKSLQNIHKSHNVSVLMYHLVCGAKYRRVVMSRRVDEVLRTACLEIEKRWELVFLEIGLDRDHAHFPDPVCADLQPDNGSSRR